MQLKFDTTAIFQLISNISIIKARTPRKMMVSQYVWSDH